MAATVLPTSPAPAEFVIRRARGLGTAATRHRRAGHRNAAQDRQYVAQIEVAHDRRYDAARPRIRGRPVAMSETQRAYSATNR